LSALSVYMWVWEREIELVRVWTKQSEWVSEWVSERESEWVSERERESKSM
jgi:hypothetical protein